MSKEKSVRAVGAVARGSRVAIVGARCRRQGTGPYVARALLKAGCRIEAIVGTSQETVNEAREALGALGATACRGYLSVADLVAEENIDAVAVTSPPEHHKEALTLLGAAGRHVWCEKPLLWDDTLPGASEEAATELARGLVALFGRNGKVLAVGSQWVWALGAFFELFPEGHGEPITTLDLELGPTTTGPRAVVDAAPHLLSLLRALAGPGRIEAIEVVWDGDATTVRFRYLHARAAAACALQLCRTPTQPRPFALGINGRRVRRQIDMPEYRQWFTDGPRRTLLSDPLHASIASFLNTTASGGPPDLEGILAEFTQLHRLARAAAHACPPLEPTA